MTTTTRQPADSTRKNHSAKSEVDASLLWYVPNKKIRTREAADEAIHIADTLLSHGQAKGLDEHRLFVAMHTCAYWASGSSRSRKVTASQKRIWMGRWDKIRNHIADLNIGLVYSMMEQVQATHLDWDGMTSEGMYALLRAVDRFNPWQGYKFSTYACNIIVRALLRYRKTVVRHQDRYPAVLENTPEEYEPESDLNLDVNLDRLQHVLSTNKADLTGIESEVLNLRFPRRDGEGQTFKEIAGKIGLSKERVRQIQLRALEKLRSVLCEDSLVAWH